MLFLPLQDKWKINPYPGQLSPQSFHESALITRGPCGLEGSRGLLLTTRILAAVLKKCRPDWDITKPELKAAWQQGRKELFYPYGKTYVQTLGEQD
jgi:hypothetical protein